MRSAGAWCLESRDPRGAEFTLNTQPVHTTGLVSRRSRHFATASATGGPESSALTRFLT
ncbi:MAG: hypothetical protein JWM72_2645 [Actinomycetia bacterium]|jgi:hypothetical protein|nr:hypothetical protein [Actinomycetes bacterium]MDQ1458981.1 hypothetical protein [Actinomycetota bacterium]